MHQIKEVEIKARIQNLDSLLHELEALGCILSEPLVQKDIVFLPKGITFANLIPGTNILRIREQPEKTIFTLKQSSKRELAKVEKEIEVSNGEVLEEIIQLLGFYEVVRINKSRRKCMYQEFEVCIDEVEGLGLFIEVERITSDDEEKTQNEMFAFLETLGIQKEDKVEKGYDTLTLEKK